MYHATPKFWSLMDFLHAFLTEVDFTYSVLGNFFDPLPLKCEKNSIWPSFAPNKGTPPLQNLASLLPMPMYALCIYELAEFTFLSHFTRTHGNLRTEDK